jgi:ATP-dependent Lhr-like helicase
VSNFERLHSALQYHIVNSLGWRELRPFQDAVIPSILDGQHLIVLAPTAGGKTEAAFFPLVSRMLSEGWSGLSVLYLCPIKALLNNLDVRLQRYCALLGRRSSLWHGDVTTSSRRKILREPPDVLLTTPESLEVMLVSPNVDARSLFSGLQAVVVDEIHAFAGDDRGWHMLSVLERVTRLAGRELQRIGLSATVGNPEVLIEWLAGSCQGERRVLLPPPSSAAPADVKLDFVGSLENAAVVISRLHRGEKRLVFIDSRAKAEQLGSQLRQLGVTAFVTHSSLSQEQRHQAEDAFANREDCVIVATSVLELGIDVGNLDRVIQIDSPPTVSSFLQRMGRTGRRTGTTRNCLFLATRDETLLQAAGLIDLWESGYVEPTQPPVEPYHVLAQQLMALILQESGIGRRTWFEWVRRVPAFSQMPAETIESVVQWMLDHEILWEDQGILGIGRAGEEEYGRRHFMELLSVFLSPPLFTVLHGRQEIGFVDELTFLGKKEGPRILLLGGRSWHVTHIDWSRKTAYVEAVETGGRSRWKGEGRGLSFRLCQAIKAVLTTDEVRPWWSNRAREQLTQVRGDFAWLTPEATTVLVNADAEVTWWTFAGIGANASLAFALSQATQSKVSHESFGVTFEPQLRANEIEQAILSLQRRNVKELLASVDERALHSLKFSECMPPEIAITILKRRLQDAKAVRNVNQSRIRVATATNTHNSGASAPDSQDIPFPS